MKFKLICEYEEGDLVTHEFNKELLSDVLMRMQDFLKGCGYVFDGTLDIVPDEEMFPSVQTESEPQQFNFRGPDELDIQPGLRGGLAKEYRNSDVDQDGRC